MCHLSVCAGAMVLTKSMCVMKGALCGPVCSLQILFPCIYFPNLVDEELRSGLVFFLHNTRNVYCNMHPSKLLHYPVQSLEHLNFWRLVRSNSPSPKPKLRSNTLLKHNLILRKLNAAEFGKVTR